MGHPRVTLVAESLLRDTLAGHACATVLWGTLVRHSCGARLSENLVRNSCRIESQGPATGSETHEH